ncbi:MAG: uracil-DNA glycosylase [Thermoleophilaceae bacterium]|nr:uracil-DNA glycosylase [Thermoleophilaceae bacterium]
MARSIEEISAEILAHKSEACGFEPCTTCTQLVPGNGDPSAAVMLIGEAPGKNEDAQGIPFVGAAGKLLDELLASVSLSRESVFVANVLKARPPGNRDPLPDEAAHHWPWLEEQISAVDPDVIVLLGRHAMERFLPGRRISEIHGEARLKDGQVYLPVYHPAAALYNGGLRSTVFADFAQLPSLVEKVRETGRDQLRARSGGISGGPDGLTLSGTGGDDLPAEFADSSETAASAPSPATFAGDYADPLDGMEAARMVPPPREVPAGNPDEPPRPGPGQSGLF